MKVSELIDALQKMPQDADVCAFDKECGLYFNVDVELESGDVHVIREVDSVGWEYFQGKRIS